MIKNCSISRPKQALSGKQWQNKIGTHDAQKHTFSQLKYMEKTNALYTFTVYDAAVATEDEVVPSINAVLLVLGADESVDVFVAVPATVPDDIFFT